MTNISKETLRKIKNGEVRPHPRWHFLVRRTATWMLFGLAILFGSVACGIAIFQIRYAEWDLPRHMRHGFLEFMLLVFPYLWIALLAGFTGGAFYFFRHTEKGYQPRALRVVFLSMVFSFIGGGLLYFSGFSGMLEEVFQTTIPLYRELEEHKHSVWMKPEQGLLAGRITRVMPGGLTMELEDLRGELWVVDIHDAQWRGRLAPVVDLRIKIIGRKEGAGAFVAEQIRPWEGPRRLERGHGSRGEGKAGTGKAAHR